MAHSYEYVKDYFSKNGCTLLSTDYTGTNEKNLRYIAQCNHHEIISFSKFKSGDKRICTACTRKAVSEKQRYSYHFIKNFFHQNNCELLAEEYQNNAQLLDYICECGNQSVISFANFKNGVRCNRCAGNKRSIAQNFGFEYVQEYFEQHDCVLLDKEYFNCDKPLRYICSCGNEQEITFYNFKLGQRCRECKYEKISGNKHWNFNPDLSIKERINKRTGMRYGSWRNAVYRRDNFTCQVCGDKRGHNLNAHHLDGYRWCIDRRTDVSNGVTLCDNCHNDFHRIYGVEHNAKEQFQEYIASAITCEC
jgi:hypothetical protein